MKTTQDEKVSFLGGLETSRTRDPLIARGNGLSFASLPDFLLMAVLPHALPGILSLQS